MRFKYLIVCLVGFGLLLAGTDAGIQPPAQAASPGDNIKAPVLKWQYGGCFSNWCEKGWYSSPAVADLNGDGRMEVVGATHSVVALDGKSGNLLWRAPSGHDVTEPEAQNAGRTWPGVAIADIDVNGDLEIVSVHWDGYVSVYDEKGRFEPGWPQRPTTEEMRGVVLADLDDDPYLEIIVTGGVYDWYNTWVYEHDGSLRPGWPQWEEGKDFAYGVWNDNAAVGDLDGDGRNEIVVPSDMHFISAYEANGKQIKAHPMYGDKVWGEVGVWESLETEIRGYGYCNGDRAESYRVNFAFGTAAISDVNGDGKKEVVVTGSAYDCYLGRTPSQYRGVYIFNGDRSRFNKDGFDWRVPPIDTGHPLVEDYDVIASNQPAPVLVDLDGDSFKEIIYSSYDGRMHAFWLDKTEHYNWPYSVNNPAEGFLRHSSAPVVADLNGDGHPELIFSSWVQKDSTQLGKLHILDYQGNLLHEVNLPGPLADWASWNGALASPTVANLDDDQDLEVVVNTVYGGLAAFDLPGTGDAQVLWPTGRGNFRRTGEDPNVAPGPADQALFVPILKNP